ncbi:SelB C-terminal domain-containing protein [Kytococcus sedentarius]|uniref:SelB domain-containing protein n=1 Tax=Kytococcus sedentarius TaxID=1276 RepID=UPI0035BBC5F3
MRRVLATAGHVDHGKSTLVRALTGRDPDRLAQEKERGLTIELGFAWTTLPDGADVAFVDVPGHQRFIGTMLSGLGPAPAVVFVVAADQGWQAQSAEHLAAVRALGLRHLLLVVTRSDLADPGPTLAVARERLAVAGIEPVGQVAVSAVTGEGMDELRAALGRLVAALPEPDAAAPVRLWADRAFTVGGSGTVVTGTLGAGTLHVGDELELLDEQGQRSALQVRGLHSQDTEHQQVGPVSRAAVNLRRVGRDEVGRGAVLLTPGAWESARVVDVAVEPVGDGGAGGGGGAGAVDAVGGSGVPDAGRAEPPQRVTLHVGTADHEVHCRALGSGHARLTLPVALPWRVGDRVILRDPGSRRLWAAVVRDVDPLPLRRRGAGRARGEALAAAVGAVGALRRLRLAERGVETADRLARLGLLPAPESAGAGPGDEDGVDAHRIGDLWVDPAAWAIWRDALAAAVRAHHDAKPLSAGLTPAEAAHGIELPAEHAAALLPALAEAAGLAVRDGRVRDPQAGGLGPAEGAIAQVEAWLREDPFAAPEARDLDDLGLGARELAAAARLGRVLRLPGEVVLLPDGPARAMRVLAGLPQPFTTSEARQALGTTRRVAIPLLEHLDSRGWTRRVDAQSREIVR